MKTLVPDSIQVVVMDGRCIIPELVAWLQHVPNVWRVSSWPEVPGGDDKHWWLRGSARNLIVRRFLADSPLGHLLIVDDDIVPGEYCHETIASEAPIVGARYWARWGGYAHGSEPGVVGCSFVKYSRAVLEAVGPDPFTPADDECECQAFCRRAREKGFLPVKAGYVGHQVPVVVMPDGRGGALMRPPTRPSVIAKAIMHHGPSQAVTPYLE